MTGLDRGASRQPFLDISPASWPEIIEGLGEASFRIRQIIEWIFRKRAENFLEMTDLPIAFREKMEEKYVLRNLVPGGSEKSSLDGTTRFLFKMPGGGTIPCVYLPFEDRHSLCLSTQIGCAWGCVFCASGKVKFERNLSAQEVCEQIFLAEKITGKKMDSVLFMGMGEPLSAYPSLLKALILIRGDIYMGFGARHVTVSTSGLVPQIEKLALEAPKVNLAVSLHAANDELRKKLLPRAAKWSIKEVLGAAKLFSKTQGTKVTFEYILLDEVNDTPRDAMRLANLLRGFVKMGDYFVNLIAYNPVPGLPYKSSSHAKMEEFAKILKSRDVPVHLRKPQGSDIGAGCGQLGE